MRNEGILVPSAAGKKILEVRAQHPERILAEHYPALGMDPELMKAHEALDRLVDKAFGATRKLTTTEARLAILFANYASMASSSGSSSPAPSFAYSRAVSA